MGGRMSKSLIVCIAVLLALGGCKQESDPTESSVETRTLRIVDSIGVEMGDSAYVIGSIAAIGHTPSGAIAILDRPSANVKLYDRNGNHISTIGGRGEGPGQLTSPDAMVLWPCGDISILDPYRGGYFRYDSQGNYIGRDLEITRNVHLDIIAMSDSEFVSVKSRFLLNEGETPRISLFIGRFPFSIEPETVYWETVLVYDPATFGDDVLKNYFYMSWTADPETGDVYIFPFNECDYRILRYDSHGALLGEIVSEAPVVEKTQLEIDQERDFIRGWLTALEGGEPQYSVDCEPYPYRLPVSDLDVDAQGNIWARRGTEDIPYFDIWTPEGELIGHAVLEDASPESRNWSFTIDRGGIVAFDQYPEDFQRIFVIE